MVVKATRRNGVPSGSGFGGGQRRRVEKVDDNVGRDIADERCRVGEVAIIDRRLLASSRSKVGATGG